MSFEAVDVVITDKTPSALPVVGVVVKIYNQAGSMVLTQGLTDSAGMASFLLESGFTRQLRFYKLGAAIPNPLYIEVLESGVNTFDVKADVFVSPVATDPRLCRASGFFRTASGSPAANLDLHFIPKFNPILLEGRGVLTERTIVRTDADGYVELDLIRFGMYNVTAQGIDDVQRCIEVPDLPSANLPDLLFPVVDRVVFSPVGSFSVSIGATLEVTPTVYASDGRVLLGTAREDVLWSVGDSAVVALDVGATTLRILGLTSGSTTLKVQRRDPSIIRIPSPAVIGDGTMITVP